MILYYAVTVMHGISGLNETYSEEQLKKEHGDITWKNNKSKKNRVSISKNKIKSHNKFIEKAACRDASGFFYIYQAKGGKICRKTHFTGRRETMDNSHIV